MVADQGRALDDDEAVMRLRPADPEESAWLQRYIGLRREMGQVLGAAPSVGSGQEGPITSAVLLRGGRFYQDLLDAPERAHHLLDVVTETFITFVRYVRGVNGQPLNGGSGIADDMAGTLSPAMWPEFVVPYWRRIYEALGPGRRSVHTELLRPAHLPFLIELGIDSYDPGNDQYLTVEDVARGVGNTRFTWNLFTVRDTMEGTPESIEALYTHAVEAGAPAMMTELCRRTPRENVRAFVAVARRYE
jgi:uroporphyrinogen-III decarboxylase